MRLLIVDDAKTDLDACRTSAKKWNKSHSSESQIVLIEKTTFQEAQEYFACHESCDVDGIILDLKLGRLPDAGQKLIDALDAMHRRVPIVVFTATQDPLSFQYLLGAFKKGDKPYDAAFERFEIAQKVGLTKILGCDGVIDRQLKDIFDKAIVPRLDSWKKYVDAAGSENAERALSRSVVMHLHEAMDEDDAFAPDEFYVTLLSSKADGVVSGGIFTTRNAEAGVKHYVAMSPACDLVIRADGKPKSPTVLLARLEDFNTIYEKACEGMTKADSKKKQMAKLERNEYAGYYHYFPAAVGLNRMLLNFRELMTVPYASMRTSYSTSGYCVSPYFFRDVQSRFSAYYGRQGQPEINSH